MTALARLDWRLMNPNPVRMNSSTELDGLSIAPPEGNTSWNMHQWELR
jgi:hypothetical protein